jgi:hypothetical protein
MKKYTLDFKYIRNEYAMPLAILDCILDAVIDGKSDDTEKHKIRRTFDAAIRWITNAMRMDLEPTECIKMFDKLELLSNCGCYRKLHKSIEDVEALVTELIEIEFLGEAPDGVMAWVPDFDSAKIKVTVLPKSTMKPIVKRYSDFESTLASILYNREYTGPTETEEDIEKSFGSYLELAKKLAPDLMEKARREMLIEQETTENKRLNLDE